MHEEKKVKKRRNKMNKWINKINDGKGDLEESAMITNVLDKLGDEMEKVAEGKSEKFSIPAEDLFVLIDDITDMKENVYVNEKGEKLNVFMVSLSTKDIVEKRKIALIFQLTPLGLDRFKEALPEGTYIGRMRIN